MQKTMSKKRTLKELRSRILGRPTMSTLYRWIHEGLKNRRTGQTIRLKARRYGRDWYVADEDLEDFLDAINDRD